MSVEDAEGKRVMQKITGARECSRIEHFGVDAGERRRRRWCGPKRQKHSRAAHGQKNWKAQQERGVVERWCYKLHLAISPPIL